MEFDQFINDYLIKRYPNAEFTNIFLSQMYHFFTQRILNIWTILGEIDYLEGRRTSTQTKKEREFKRNSNLSGIWYKHFFDAQFMMKNLINHVSSENLKRYWEDAYEKSEGVENSEKFFHSVLSYNITLKAFEERNVQKRMTGEWIIYKPDNGKNYYLMLATHGNDEIIEKMINYIYVGFKAT